MSSKELLFKIYETLAAGEEIYSLSEFDAMEKEKEFLEEIELYLESRPDDPILLALQCELLHYLDKNKSLTISRFLLEKFAAIHTEDAAIVRGICFYVCALEADNNNGYIDTFHTIELFRLSLKNFPGHWNSALMFADHALNSDKNDEEILEHLENAIAANKHPAIIHRILTQAAYVCFMSRLNQQAINYYEKSREFGLLDWHRADYLALAYARVNNFRKSLDFFKLSYEVKKAQELELRRFNEFFKYPERGIDDAIIWELALESVDQVEKQADEANLVYVATCFRYLPVASSALVLDSVRTEISSKSTVNDIKDAFDKSKTASPGEISLTILSDWTDEVDSELNGMIGKAIQRLKKRLREKNALDVEQRISGLHKL